MLTLRNIKCSSQLSKKDKANESGTSKCYSVVISHSWSAHINEPMGKTSIVYAYIVHSYVHFSCLSTCVSCLIPILWIKLAFDR